MADNDHVWNLETCKKNTLEFKVKCWKLAGKCFDLWVVIPKIGKVSQQKTFLIEFVFDRERQEPNKLFHYFQYLLSEFDGQILVPNFIVF